MKVDAFLICDDIRNEIGGKQSLMGVYGDTILFEVPPTVANQWPKAIRLGVFIRLLIEKQDRQFQSISFRVEILHDETESRIAEGSIPLRKSIDAEKLNIAIVHNSFLIQKTGALTFKISCFSDDKNEISLGNPITSIRVEQRVLPV